MARLVWHGHACFTVESREGRVVIDPFLSGNPKADVGPDGIGRVDAGAGARRRAGVLKIRDALEF